MDNIGNLNNGIANKFQTQKFINTLFHELKIPISSINGYASILLSGELGKVPYPTQKIIQKIKSLSLYASELIANLLSMARLGIRRIAHYEKISINDVVSRTLDTLKVSIRSRHLKINTKFRKEVDAIWALPLDLEQIVINILSNAVKFTPKNGRIYIFTNKINDRLCLSFRDTGIGIPEEALPKVSEDFYRADNVISQYEGSGLGLATVKRLLEYNKGDISIKSKVNKGTSVVVTLPFLTDKEVFDYELEQRVSEASASGGSFCLLMAVDPSGDQMRKIINEAIRKGDHSYMIGKNRFVAVLPDSDYTDTRLIYKRLRSKLEERIIVGGRKRKTRPNSNSAVTFAVFPQDGETKEKILSYLTEEINKPSSYVTVSS